MNRNTISVVLIALMLLSSVVSTAAPTGRLCSDLYLNTQPNSTDKLPQDGMSLVRRQKELLKKLFQTTGFANREELTNILDKLTGGQAMIRDLILQEQIAVGLAASNLNRNSILTNGILNQHETSTSGAVNSKDFRNYSEAAQLGISPNTVYHAMNPKLKAKYAMLEPAPGSMLIPRGNAYGDDIYYFNLAKVRERMTWTPGDSLYRAQGYEPRAWDQIFLSWDDRILLIPILLNNDVHPGGSLNLQATSFQSSPIVIPIKTTNKHDSYVEVQIWGPLTLDDVIIFKYKKFPPEGSFLNELHARGIEIIDGREK